MGGKGSGRPPGSGMVAAHLAGVKIMSWIGEEELSIDRAAIRLGIDSLTLRRYVTGERMPSLETSDRIQKVMGAPVTSWLKPVTA